MSNPDDRGGLSGREALSDRKPKYKPQSGTILKERYGKENGRVIEAERQGILFRGSFQWNIHQSHQYTSAENRRDNAVDNGKEMAKRHPRKLFAEEKTRRLPLRTL